MTAFVASWLINDTIALPEFASGQQTPGTKRLWKQMDFLKLSSWSRRAGQLPRSRQVPLPPSGVEHGLLEGELDDATSLALGNGISTLFPELIFSAVDGVVDDVCPEASGSKCVRVSLPKFSSVLPSPRPSLSLWRCSNRSPSPSVAGQESFALISPLLSRRTFCLQSRVTSTNRAQSFAEKSRPNQQA